MARCKWYGSLNNRLEENHQFCETIEVGTGVTEYSWSDREAYEVVAVKDQKHVSIRRLNHKPAEGALPMSNDWELFSNPDAPTYDLVKRGNYWYTVSEVTADEVREFEACEDMQKRNEFFLWMAMNDFDKDKVLEKGKQTKYHKWNISFGFAEYYYDYSF